jgi:putative sigma-54 modulation protein
MRIDIRGRNVEVTDDLREQVAQRFKRIGQQLSPLARIEVVVSEERNPAITDKFVAEATLHVKGVTLHAHEATPEMMHTIHELAEDMRRQVKRHREKRRKRSRTRHLVNQMQGRPSGNSHPSGGPSPSL